MLSINNTSLQLFHPLHPSDVEWNEVQMLITAASLSICSVWFWRELKKFPLVSFFISPFNCNAFKPVAKRQSKEEKKTYI